MLHEGRIAEMATGEGKTLVATLPAYLHALKGQGVHILTTNDYLARRDAQRYALCTCVYRCLHVCMLTMLRYVHANNDMPSIYAHQHGSRV